jgi:hypothetical protein
MGDEINVTLSAAAGSNQQFAATRRASEVENQAGIKEKQNDTNENLSRGSFRDLSFRRDLHGPGTAAK